MFGDFRYKEKQHRCCPNREPEHIMAVNTKNLLEMQKKLDTATQRHNHDCHYGGIQSEGDKGQTCGTAHRILKRGLDYVSNALLEEKRLEAIKLQVIKSQREPLPEDDRR